MKNIFIGVGCEPQQELAYQVLKNSIEVNFSSQKYNIKIKPLHRLEIPSYVNKIILKKQGTPFSFQRFYFAHWVSENANDFDLGIYLDSDMLVFSNIESLAETFLDLDQAIAICDTKKYWGRKQQQAVMAFNCHGAVEIKNKFIKYANGDINYKNLMTKPNYKSLLPFTWNSQEEIMHDTNLIHYTDMDFQPWLKKDNMNAGIWLSYLRLFIKSEDGKNLLVNEILKKNVRPSLAELLQNPPNHPVVSFSWSLKDIFFIPPHRLKIFSGVTRTILAPALNIFLYFSKIIKNNRVNKI